MDDNELRTRIISCLQHQHDAGEKETTTIEVYRLIADENLNISFSTVDRLLREISKERGLRSSIIHTKFVTSEAEYEEHTLVFFTETVLD